MTFAAGPSTLDHIAALVHEVRPAWDQGLVRIVLFNLASRVDGGDLAVAAIRAAQNHNLPTPKAIGWRGPHWRDLDSTPPELAKPPHCGICGRIEPDCWSIRLADDDHIFEPAVRSYRR